MLKSLRPLKYKTLARKGGDTLKIREKRISKPQHVRQLMSEQINILRKDPEADAVKARAIAYLASISLTAMRDSDLIDRIEALEKENELRKKNQQT